MDIEKIVLEKVNEMVAEGSIQGAIEESIERSITDAVKSQFERWGGIRKELDRALEEGLQINLNDLDLSTYNQQMGVAVKTKLANVWHGAAVEKFNSEIDQLLTPAPREITLTKLIDDLMDIARELDDYDQDDAEITYEESGYSKDSASLSIVLGEYQDDISLFLIEGKIRINHKQRYNPTSFNPVQALIFKLYAAGTTITEIESFNEYNCDLHLRGY